MKSKPVYTVITTDGDIVGPISSEEIKALVSVYMLGPESQIRQGDAADWALFSDVAGGIGVELPSMKQWDIERQSFIAKDGKNTGAAMLGCGLILLVGWGIMGILGLGFAFIPLLAFYIMFVVLCKIFNLFSNVDVLSAPMWTDFRKEPVEGALLQLLAFVIAMIAVGGFYLIQITNQ